MPRPPIAGLFDHAARHWRPVESLDAMRETIDTPTVVGTFRCAVNRPTARLGDPGPGLTNVGERMLYVETSIDLRARDLIELTAGPEAGRILEVDEDPTNVRGHHIEARCRIFTGTLETDGDAGGDS